MLNACVASTDSENSAVLAVRYHLTTTGGRLRARMALDAASRLTLPAKSAVTVAAVCELLHNASLVHDDLIDRSPMRRGQETVWSRFGDGVAICAGDLLLNAAYASMAEIEPVSFLRELSLRVHRSTHKVICGQAAELRFSQDQSTEAENYEELAIGKSASLLSLCLQLPLTIADFRNAVPTAQKVAESFAVAYQIADDLHDVEEDRLANSLNFVQILSAAQSCPLDIARNRAAARAEKLLIETCMLAKELPFDCAAVLVEHASKLLTQLRWDYSISSVVTG